MLPLPMAFSYRLNGRSDFLARRRSSDRLWSIVLSSRSLDPHDPSTTVSIGQHTNRLVAVVGDKRSAFIRARDVHRTLRVFFDRRSDVISPMPVDRLRRSG